jgi:hypothetical protein
MAMSLYFLAVRRYRAASIAAGLLVLTRIDGAVWAALVVTFIFMRSRRKFSLSLLCLIAILLPWFAFSFFYFGGFVPHSIIAKRVITPHYELAGLKAYGVWFADAVDLTGFRGMRSRFFALWLGAVALSVAGIAREKKRRVLWLPVIFPFLLVAFYYAGNAPRDFQWYLVPVTWCAIVTAAIGLGELHRLCEGLCVRHGLRRWWSVMPIVVIVALFGSVLYANDKRMVTYRWMEQRNEEETRRAIGTWLDENAAPEAVVAMEAIGYQGYYANRRIIDLAGLISPEVVGCYEASRTHAGGFYKVAGLLRPDYIVLRWAEVNRNRHFHGGRLFDTDEQRRYFQRHYREARQFHAPFPEVWGPVGHLVIYERVPAVEMP